MKHLKLKREAIAFLGVAITTLVFFQNCGGYKSSQSAATTSSNQGSSFSSSSVANSPAKGEPTLPAANNIIKAVSGLMGYSNKLTETVTVDFDKVYNQADVVIQCKINSVIVSCGSVVFQTDVVKQTSQAVLTVAVPTGEGAKSLEVTARHLPSSNLGGYKVGWVLDKTPPAVVITPLFNVNYGMLNATFTLIPTDDNKISDVICLLDNNAYTPCGNPLTLPVLTGGTHYLQVKTVDIAGNSTNSVKVSWLATVTSANTQINLAGKPSPVTETAVANFSFSTTSNIVRTTCLLDAKAAEACSGSYAVTNATAGNHKFTVTGYDLADKQIAQVTYDWFVNIVNNVNMVEGAVIPLIGLADGNQKINYRFTVPAGVTGGAYYWTVGGTSYNTVNPFVSLTIADNLKDKDFVDLCVSTTVGGTKYCSKLILSRFTAVSPLVFDGSKTTFNIDVQKIKAISKSFVMDDQYIYSSNAKLPFNGTDAVKVITDQHVTVGGRLYFYDGTAFNELVNLNMQLLRPVILPGTVAEASRCGLVSDGTSLVYGSGTIITNVNAKDAQIIPIATYPGNCSLPLLKDSKNVVLCKYCYINSNNISTQASDFIVWPNADPATFSSMDLNYFKDKAKVYYMVNGNSFGEIVGADPATFSFTNPKGVYAFDAQKVYFKGVVVAGAAGNDMKIVNNNILLSNGFVFNAGVKVDGLAAADFKIIFTGDIYNSFILVSGKDSLYLMQTNTASAATLISNVVVSSFKLVKNLGTYNGNIFTDGTNLWYINSNVFTNQVVPLGPGGENDVKIINSGFVTGGKFYSASTSALGVGMAVDDVASFVLIGGYFYGTTNSVYVSSYGKTTADRATFKLVGGGFSGKDATNVYCYNSVNPLAGADVATYTTVGTNGWYFKDKNKVYYLCNPVAGADAATVELISTTVIKDKNGCFTNGNPSACP